MCAVLQRYPDPLVKGVLYLRVRAAARSNTTHNSHTRRAHTKTMSTHTHHTPYTWHRNPHTSALPCSIIHQPTSRTQRAPFPARKLARLRRQASSSHRAHTWPTRHRAVQASSLSTVARGVARGLRRRRRSGHIIPSYHRRHLRLLLGSWGSHSRVPGARAARLASFWT